jgi:predicted house-cleaning noncanonical NTP pyrophosphatase (MazG superfamily)
VYLDEREYPGSSKIHIHKDDEYIDGIEENYPEEVEDFLWRVLRQEDEIFQMVKYNTTLDAVI